MKQKSYLFVGIFAMISLLASDTFADGTHTDAKGTGNAKTTIETGIQIKIYGELNFGKITRFGKNPAGTVSISKQNYSTQIIVSNPEQIKVESATPGSYGFIVPKSAPSGVLAKNVKISDAILSNGNGDFITVDNIKTFQQGGGSISSGLYAGGYHVGGNILGTLTLNGNEPDGEYSTEFAGGHPYTITVDF